MGAPPRPDGSDAPGSVCFDEMEVPAKLTDELQLQCATYLINDIKGHKLPTQRSGAPIKCVVQRLRGKDGRLRGNLSGKRVNFSGRAVISPDPNLDVNEIGVPYEIAMRLTYPETVTPYNIEDLQRRVDNGPDVLHGAKAVIDREGRMTYLGSSGRMDSGGRTRRGSAPPPPLSTRWRNGCRGGPEQRPCRGG